ncbi:MAG: hypothetical protein A2158_02325 [Chloroflexi bacterium RBG_13_46_14]|nr:MAG: hypothetical protein A2158_02325 [Chloroflexi bacterium RBG_13_46_14]
MNYKIPVAPISSYTMESVAKSDTRAAPLPFIYTPLPVIGMADDVLDGYINGNDPDTGKSVIGEIIDTLTKPVSSRTGEVGSKPVEVEKAAAPQVLLGPDTEDNLQRLFYEKGWTDGLPVILPTEERVKKMLAGTSHAPDEVVCQAFNMDTGERFQCTVENIAVVAVMAGARPEYFPVILAIAASGHSSLSPSTTAHASMLMVNGPIRNEIGMNSGVGAFSPVSMANAVIGRAWTLLSISWGYAKVRKVLWSSQGNNYTYNNMCIAENEEKSVWEPLHVQKGFKADESVVSFFTGWNVLSSLHCAAHRTIGEEICLQLSVIPALNSAATIMMDPLVARTLKNNEGFTTKQDYSRWISENAMIPAERYWKTDYIDMLVASEAAKGVEPYASWKKLPDNALINHYHNPDNVNIIVVGGESSPLWKTADYRYGSSVSVDKWR